MYLFYIDESGNRDASLQGIAKDGNPYEKDHLFVYFAVSLMEGKWRRFQSAINAVKLKLIEDVRRATGQQFTLADVQVKSNLIRRPKLRDAHPFFRFLTRAQVTELADTFYEQLDILKMRCFAVVIDKRKLADYIDSEKMLRKAYELLLERIQNFLAEFHRKHLGVIVADDTGKEMNRSLTLKHVYFQTSGTSSGAQLRNVVETPFFVADELSNGVQLADLCAYNVYRVFKYSAPDYKYFMRMLPRFYRSGRTRESKLDGLKVFPDDSVLIKLASRIGEKAARS